MSDDAPKRRFQVVDGDKPSPKYRSRKTGEPVHVRPYKCGHCSEQLGYSFTALIQVRLDAVEENDKLRGGALWWACARCLHAKYRIRGLP
ncbi:hypothetical protein [Dichotomicrobium thermohalophilum]|uniref:Uncharacterized protein n=1 Tax=Dichotomicrobium thermohalophilum TaxID=933063 RepID=A0A397PHG5_9HYPH|nr:hypothetical protein [Dichotomicrobium thermohalophilum]RIA47319.1 hypothetical protein BXY53_2393 [Dichotomicrobium thermohalophilum]